MRWVWKIQAREITARRLLIPRQCLEKLLAGARQWQTCVIFAIFLPLKSLFGTYLCVKSKVKVYLFRTCITFDRFLWSLWNISEVRWYHIRHMPTLCNRPEPEIKEADEHDCKVLMMNHRLWRIFFWQEFPDLLMMWFKVQVISRSIVKVIFKVSIVSRSMQFQGHVKVISRSVQGQGHHKAKGQGNLKVKGQV